jgi:hypothetical protein
MKTMNPLSFIDQRRLVALASVEWSFNDQPPMLGTQALLAKCFWLCEDERESRVCLLAADLRGLLGSSKADPGVIASALAARARSAFLNAGAKPPPAYLDDFPGAPFMASADVCSVSCAVSVPHGGLAAMEQAAVESLSSMFASGSFWTRHLKLEEAPSGAVERRANQLLTSIRQARVGS